MHALCHCVGVLALDKSHLCNFNTRTFLCLPQLLLLYSFLKRWFLKGGGGLQADHSHVWVYECTHLVHSHVPQASIVKLRKSEKIKGYLYLYLYHDVL